MSIRPPDLRPPYRIELLLVLGALALAIAYFASFYIVFDTSRTAYTPGSSLTVHGKAADMTVLAGMPSICGPCPRPLFVTPGQALGSDANLYTGKEWPFWFYCWQCQNFVAGKSR